jgi:hypothetical protein
MAHSGRFLAPGYNLASVPTARREPCATHQPACDGPLVSAGEASAQTFDPSTYLGQGDAYNCADFTSQADAQAVLRADPSDPKRLDADKDGIACERNPAPYDPTPVPRP